MIRTNSLLLKAALVAAVLSAGAVAGFAAGRGPSEGVIHAPAANQSSFHTMRSGFYPSYGYGYGYSSPFLIPPSTPVAPRPYMPNGWWASPYPSEDPRQAGYNPRAGYRWEDVTTLILGTSPQKAEITLDGSPIGSATDLGPIQLPLGDHTLRVEAEGYEPSETVLSVKAASVRRLQITLKAAATASKQSQ
jgi:PEGA domain